MYKRDKNVKSGSYIRSKFEAGQKKKKAGKSKRGNPISKVTNSVKGALSLLSRKTDSSATRKIEGPKTKRLSPPTAKQAGNKLIQTGQATVKKAKFNQLSPYQQSVQTRNESRANSKRDKLNDSISRAKAKMGPQNTDYKNNYIQSEIDKLKKQLAKIK